MAFKGLGFGVQDLGFGVWASVWGLGFREIVA